MPRAGWMQNLLLAILLGSTIGCSEIPQNPKPTAPKWQDATCRTLARVPGPEDLVLDRSGEASAPRLLVSSQERRGDEPRPAGAIYAVPLEPMDVKTVRKLPLVGRDDCSFHPHGIDLVQRKSETGEAGDGVSSDPPWLLYVLNHHDPADATPQAGCFPRAEAAARTGKTVTSVEIFKIESRRLVFVQRLADPEVLVHGNDLVAEEGGDLWVTSPPPGRGSQLVEALYGSFGSKLVHFECTSTGDLPCVGRWRVARSVGRLINGIALGPPGALGERARLYVASSAEPSLYVVPVAEDGSLSAPSRLPVGTGADNLSWETDEQKALLLAAHPNPRRFLQHARRSEVPSPSEARRIQIQDCVPEVLWRDGGSLVSAASTALCYEGDLVLGQVFEKAIVRCRPPVEDLRCGLGEEES